MAKTINLNLQENNVDAVLRTTTTTPDTIVAAAASSMLTAIQYVHANVDIADPEFRGYKITSIS